MLFFCLCLLYVTSFVTISQPQKELSFIRFFWEVALAGTGGNLLIGLVGYALVMVLYTMMATLKDSASAAMTEPRNTINGQANKSDSEGSFDQSGEQCSFFGLYYECDSPWLILGMLISMNILQGTLQKHMYPMLNMLLNNPLQIAAIKYCLTTFHGSSHYWISGFRSR